MAESGHKTCALREHRKLEEWNDERNKAMFQLKKRLERLNTSQPHSSLPQTDMPASEAIEMTFGDEEVLVDQDGLCDSDKPEEGNRRPRARFGRRWTHDEELCVASCGIILGRATFYGSEAPNGVRVRISSFIHYARTLTSCQ